MRNHTAHKASGNPLRSLGLSVVFAGTLLATSVAGAAAMTVSHDALANSVWVGGVPHQVAPVEGQDSQLLSQSTLLPSPANSGVPHQVAPFEFQDTQLPPQGTPPTPPANSSVPHQVAPFEG